MPKAKTPKAPASHNSFYQKVLIAAVGGLLKDLLKRIYELVTNYFHNFWL